MLILKLKIFQFVCFLLYLLSFIHIAFSVKRAHISKDPINVSDGDKPSRFLSPIPSPGVAVADTINRVKFLLYFIIIIHNKSITSL